MRFHLFLLFIVSHHQFIVIIFGYSTDGDNSFRRNNSSITVDLYQCGTNKTILNSTTNTMDSIYTNQMNSCNIICCTTNKTASLDACQVTVKSSGNVCLGRLCYPGKCDHFSSLANLIGAEKIQNNTTIVNKLSSSLTYMPWSSFVNSTQTQWNLWIDKTGLTIRHSILIILFIASISLTLMAVISVIKSIRHANTIAGNKSYRYTLL